MLCYLLYKKGKIKKNTCAQFACMCIKKLWKDTQETGNNDYLYFEEGMGTKRIGCKNMK